MSRIVWTSGHHEEFVIIYKIIASVLVVLGLVGLLVGRLGETTWAPETERTATVDLSDPGPAVVIDPGVLYVGGTQGDVTVPGSSDVSVITASNADIDAYLEGVQHTRITGLSDWQDLETKAVDADGKAKISDPTSSDLWRSVKTSKSPATVDIADFHAQETETDPQPYRAILLVTDGEQPGADSVSITWPVDAKNEWVPYAYAAGATLIIVGLVMLVVSFGSSRRGRVGATAGAAGLGGGAAGAAAAGGDDSDPGDEDATEQRPATGPIAVGGADGDRTGHDEAEGSEDPTDVIDRVEDQGAPPRGSHRHRAPSPEPEDRAGTEHEGPGNGTDTEEEQR